MIKLMTLLLEGMTPQQADAIFAKHGIPRASSLTADDLKKAYKKLMVKLYPHANVTSGSEQDIDVRLLNSAYDILTGNRGRNQTAARPVVSSLSRHYDAVPIRSRGAERHTGFEFTTSRQMREWLEEGGKIFAPGAKRNDYNIFFKDAGFNRVQIIGPQNGDDLAFGVYDNEIGWSLAFQTYMRNINGVYYKVDFIGARTFEELFQR